MKKIVSAVLIALLAVFGLGVGTAATSSASIPFGKRLRSRCHNARICSAPTPGTGPAPGRGPADVLGALGLLLGHAALTNP